MKMSAELQDQIRKLYKLGVSISFIASAINANESNLHALCSNMPYIASSKLQLEYVFKAIDMYKSGRYSMRQIGKKIGRSTNTISCWCSSPIARDSTVFDRSVVVKVLEDIETGLYSRLQLCRKYKISSSSMGVWFTYAQAQRLYNQYKKLIEIADNDRHLIALNGQPESPKPTKSMDIQMSSNCTQANESLINRLIKCITREDVQSFDKVVIQFIVEGVKIEASVKPANYTQTFTIP